jgi:hypothetical protein
MGMCYRLDSDCGAPVILCDECGFEILEAAGHNVLFKAVDDDGRYRGTGAYIPVVFVHAKCTRQYEAKHGGHHSWDSIGDWLFFLKNNSGITKKAERQTAEGIEIAKRFGMVR